MLPGMVSAVAGRRTGRMIELIGKLGLTANLKLCLDAGDSASYTSGQSWLDRSGNGYDFFLGTGSGSDSADPTFTGTAGGQSRNEFFRTDGGDRFTYDTTSEAFMEALHKDSATYTVLSVVKSSSAKIFTTSAGIQGVALQVNSDEHLNIEVIKSPLGDTVLSKTSALTVNLGGAWNIVGISYDEAAGAGTFFVNTQTEAISGAYSSPGTGAADIPMRLMEGSTSGVDMNSLLFWSDRKTDGQVASMIAGIRGRFGI